MGQDRSHSPHEQTAPSLTPRQLEILALLKAGKANKEIAYELGIGLGTVKQHVVALFKKLNVSNRAMAVSQGYQMANARPSSSAALVDPVDSALELRPACVLSLAATGPEPEAAWRLLQGVAAAATAALDTTLVTRPGSGVDVLFGLHRVHEEDAERAVALARAVARGVAAQSAGAVSVRGGLAGGYLVASMHRGGGWSGETVAGRLIGDARALRDDAPSCALLADRGARRLIAFAERAEDVPAPADETVLLPLDRPARRRNGEEWSLHLVGRAVEMAELRGHLSALRAGRGGLVWIGGEAGMGKTTLGRAFGAECRRALIEWTECRCGSPARPPLAVLPGMVRRRRPLAAGAPADELLEAAIEAVRTKAARGPLALMIDDVHAAGAFDVRLIAALAELVAEVPLLVLGVGRSMRPPPLRDLAVAGQVKLGRLAADEMAQVIADQGGAGVPEGMAEAILDLAHGVPLFAAELVRETSGREPAAAAGLPVPLTLATLVMSRVDAMALDRALLRLVARAGPLAVRALAGSWPGLPASLQRELERAVRAGILTAADGHGEIITFAHPMLEAVLRHVLLAAETAPSRGLPVIAGQGG